MLLGLCGGLQKSGSGWLQRERPWRQFLVRTATTLTKRPRGGDTGSLLPFSVEACPMLKTAGSLPALYSQRSSKLSWLDPAALNQMVLGIRHHGRKATFSLLRGVKRLKQGKHGFVLTGPVLDVRLGLGCALLALGVFGWPVGAGRCQCGSWAAMCVGFSVVGQRLLVPVLRAH